MATTYTTNLGLTVEDNITPVSKQNLYKIDALAGALQILNTATVTLTATNDIILLPTDNLTLGSATNHIDVLTIYASDVVLVGDPYITGLKYNYGDLVYTASDTLGDIPDADAYIAANSLVAPAYAHITRVDNPHAVTAAQTGAYTAAQTLVLLSVKADTADLNTHMSDTSTHGVTSRILGESDAQLISNKIINIDNNTVTNIRNANIAAGAGIAYSKLSLGSSIVNTDVSPTADIEITKIGGLFAALAGKEPTVTKGNLTTLTAGMTIVGGTGAVIGTGTSIDVTVATAANNGLLSKSDWSRFNALALPNVPQDLTTTTTGLNIVGGAGTLLGATGATVNIDTATSLIPGLLSAANHATFSAKQAALGYTPVNVAGDTMGGLLTLDNLGIKFDTTGVGAPAVPVEGQVWWNSDDHTLNMQGDVIGSVLQIGQENWLRAKNTTGSILPNGAVVYINGANTARATVALAIATAAVSSDRVIGITTEAIGVGALGVVTTFGLVRGLATNVDGDGVALSDGDCVYLSATTAGEWVKTKPHAPNHTVKVGQVVNAAAGVNGDIFVHPSTGSHLADLHDVNVESSLTTGDLLRYSSVTGIWTNTAMDADLTAIAALSGPGVAVKTSADPAAVTWANRVITGTSNRLGVANGNGVSGNPTIDVDTSLLPSPAGGDASKSLIASGANAASWSLVANGNIAASGVADIARNKLAAGTAHAIGVNDGTGYLTSAAALTNGQLLIGSTGAAPVAASITGTSNRLGVSVGAGTITLNVDATQFPNSVAANEGLPLIASSSANTATWSLPQSTVDLDHSGFVSWGSESADYYTLSAGVFTLLRSGVGRIRALKTTWAAGANVTGLAADKTYYIGLSATNTLVKIDAASIYNADPQTYYENMSTTFLNNVILYTVWMDSVVPVVCVENHPYSYATDISVHDHFRLGQVFIGTGADLRVLTAASATIQSVGSDRIDDHGVDSTVPDLTGQIMDVIPVFNNTLGRAKRYNRRLFTVSGVSVTPVFPKAYTNNGSTFTVLHTALVGGAGTITCWTSAGTAFPEASGTLTGVAGGTGDAAITFSSYTSPTGCSSTYVPANVPTPLGTGGGTRYGIWAVYISKSDLQTPTAANPIPNYIWVPSTTAYNSSANAAASLGTGASPTMTQFQISSDLLALEVCLNGFVLMDGNTRVIPAYTGQGFTAGVRTFKATGSSQFNSGAVAVAAATNVSTLTGAFNRLLSTADIDVQLALDTIDNTAAYGGLSTWAAADGVTKAITHGYATRSVIVQLYDLTTFETVYVDSVVRTDTNTVTLTSSEAPPAGGWGVLILRIG